jgi:hypothetical protein
MRNWKRGSSKSLGAKGGTPEAVDHPAHYGGDTQHETIKCLEAWDLESDALLWNAVSTSHVPERRPTNWRISKKPHGI